MVGHRCIGAKVDGRIVPFTTALRTGQTVEIITQREPNPSRDWMNPDMGFLKTAKARSKVQVFFRRRDFEQNLAAGAEILNRELLHRGLNLTREQVMAALADKVTRFNVKSTDDILAGLGAGDVTLNQIFGKLGKEFLEGPEDPNALSREAESRMQKAKQLDKSPGRGAVIVDGVVDLMTHMARCCKPIPGDDSQGFITRGRGISVHRGDCPELADLCRQHPERLIRVEWGSSARGNYEASVRIVGNDYAGFLRDVTTLTANEHVNVLGVRSRTDRSTDTAIIDISMLIADAGLLQSIMAKFKALRNVREVTRL